MPHLFAAGGRLPLPEALLGALELRPGDRFAIELRRDGFRAFAAKSAQE